MQLINQICTVDCSYFENKPYDIPSFRAFFSDMNDPLKKIILINILEIITEFKLVDFSYNLYGERHYNNGLIKELCSYLGVDRFIYHPVTNDNEYFLESLFSFNQTLYTTTKDNAILASQDAYITIDMIDEYIIRMNSCILDAIGNSPSNRLTSDTICSTIIRHIHVNMDQQLKADVEMSKWSVCLNFTDDIDKFIAIKNEFTDKNFKFVPNLKQSSLVLAGNYDRKRLNRIFNNEVYEYKELPNDYKCNILEKIWTYASKRMTICGLDDIKQLLKFNLQFSESAVNSKKHVVLLNYDLAKTLIDGDL